MGSTFFRIIKKSFKYPTLVNMLPFMLACNFNALEGLTILKLDAETCIQLQPRGSSRSAKAR